MRIEDWMLVGTLAPSILTVLTAAIFYGALVQRVKTLESDIHDIKELVYECVRNAASRPQDTNPRKYR